MSGMGLLAQVKSEPDPTQAFADAIPAMAPGSTVEPVEEQAPSPSAAALATLGGGAPSAAARWRSRRELVRGMVAQAS